MGKKWQRIDPAEIKVGDRVRVKWQGQPEVYEFTVERKSTDWVAMFSLRYPRTWYVRKPKPAKPLTRPDEPPGGSFFRVDRTGREFYRFPMSSGTDYFHLTCDNGERPWRAFRDITEPGDTITILELTEVGDKRDADA